jgi:acetyltransferase-like isoleucine patch superfamily enzyme
VIEGSCEVGDYNTFGTNVIVQRKVKIGSHCKFGSGTVIVKDVPDGSIMVGNPARYL